MNSTKSSPLSNSYNMNLFSFFLKKRKRFYSSFNGEITIVEKADRKTLFVKGVPQSGGEFVAMWEKVIGELNYQKINDCLVLGIGGGTVIHVLKKYFPRIKIIGVEIDPVMIQVAQKYFDLPSPDSSFSMVIGDAQKFLDRGKGVKKFDLVVVDLFLGRLNPPFIRSKKYLRQIKNMLFSGGRVLFNAHYQPEFPKDFEELEKRAKKIFSFVKQVFSYRFNRVLSLQK